MGAEAGEQEVRDAEAKSHGRCRAGHRWGRAAATWAGEEFWKLCGLHIPPQEDSPRALAKPALSGSSWPPPTSPVGRGDSPWGRQSVTNHQGLGWRLSLFLIHDPRSLSELWVGRDGGVLHL